jgi:hypothetical protein
MSALGSCWAAALLAVALAAAAPSAAEAEGAAPPVPPAAAPPAPKAQAQPKGGTRVVLGSGAGSARTAAAAPVSFSLRVAAASVEVLPSDGPEVRVVLLDAPQVKVALIGTGGDRMEAEFDGRRRLHQGRLQAWLPRRSRVDLVSLEGRIAVRGLGGEVRVRATSGDVDLSGAALVDAETIDGEIDVLDSSGPVTVRTVSGKVTLDATAAAARVDVESGAGPIDFRGPCGRGCHLDLETVSGEVKLELDRQSSFALSSVSHGGKLRDELGLTRGEGQGESVPGWSSWSYGGADGEIECETFSGDLIVRGRAQGP